MGKDNWPTAFVTKVVIPIYNKRYNFEPKLSYIDKKIIPFLHPTIYLNQNVLQ